MKFINKVAIITGGSTGIGKETISKLNEEKAKVYNLDIVQPEESSNSTFIKCDVSDYEQVKNAVKKVFVEEGKIDILFANAGIHLFANIEETSLEEFEKVISVNIKGVYYILKEVIPIMKEQKKRKYLTYGL